MNGQRKFPHSTERGHVQTEESDFTEFGQSLGQRGNMNIGK